MADLELDSIPLWLSYPYLKMQWYIAFLNIFNIFQWFTPKYWKVATMLSKVIFQTMYSIFVLHFFMQQCLSVLSAWYSLPLEVPIMYAPLSERGDCYTNLLTWDQTESLQQGLPKFGLWKSFGQPPLWVWLIVKNSFCILSGWKTIRK